MQTASGPGGGESRIGTVYFVGAGPGIPDLITMRGRDLVDSADAVVYDSTASRALIPAGARESGRPEIYDVRRKAIGRRVSREQISELLIRLARDGKDVVRLIAGDPVVFGRGGEEAQALNDAFVPFEIVPGITADVAAASYAGVPVTQTGMSEVVTFVSGRDIQGTSGTPTNWAALGNTGGTLVISRGIRRLRQIAEALIEGGMPAEMPALIIHRVARAGQRTVSGTIGTIAEIAAAAAVSPASVVMVGWTVILRDETAWFEKRPLFGNHFIVAPAAHHSAAITRRLRGLGANVSEIPSEEVARLDLSPLREELAQLSEFDWLIFTTRDAVVIFWEQLLGSGRDSRALAGTRIVAVGADAAAALLERGIAVDIVPARFAAEALLEKLAERADIADARVLLLAPERADDTIADDVRALGAHVTAVDMYRGILNRRVVARMRRALDQVPPVAAVFMSIQSVAAYVQAMGDDAGRIPGASIGPLVTEALAAAGIELLCEASEPSPDALALAIETALT